MLLTFNKEGNGNWYVVLPEWPGKKEDLQMVCGADAMLEFLAEGNNQVKCSIATDAFAGADVLEFVRPATELENGSFYFLKTLRGIEINLEVWLCDVTKFVFGNFPKQIYIAALN